MHEQAIRNYFPALTGLRGVLCLWVWFLHVTMMLWQTARIQLESIVGGPLATLALHGYLAVDCFFILSGFVLCSRYRDEQQVLSIDFVKRFWRARFARIYPIYGLLLAAMAFIVFGLAVKLPVHGFPPASDELTAYDPFSVGALVKSIFLVQSWDWFPRLSWNMAAWSISAEWAMYALFPFLFILVRRVESLRTAFICALILQIVLIYVLQFCEIATLYRDAAFQAVPESDTALFDASQRGSLAATEFGLLRALVGFLGGCFLYRIYQHRDFQRDKLARLVLPCVLIIVALLLWGPISYVPTWFLLAVLLLTDQQSRIARFLSTMPMQLLGHASYALYLLHIPLLGCLLLWNGLEDFVRSTSSPVLVLLLAVLTLVLLAVSVAVYWFFERPMRQLIRGRVHAE